MQIEENAFLDLNDDFSYHFNHSCNPNGALKKESDLYAIKNIKKGDEITYDYSMTVSANINWKMNCNCGSKNCRKIISNILTVPNRDIKIYLESSYVVDFIKRQFQ